MKHAFTLIETMIAVVLMAILAGTVVLGFSHSLNSARAVDAVEAIRSFDGMGRQSARESGKPVRLVFDLSNNTLEQRDGSDLATRRIHLTLPVGIKADSISIDGNSIYSGEVNIDISAHGWSHSYVVHLISTDTDHQLVFAGLTGEMSEMNDASQIPNYETTSRHDAH